MAYNILLVVEDGNWRVDSVQRVHFAHNGRD